MSHIAIAGLQLELAADQSNTAMIEREILKTKDRFPWVDMVVLGELSSHGPGTANAEPLPGPTERLYIDLARQARLWIVTGSLFEKQGDRVYNTCSVINPEGEVVSRYRKLFPFRPYEKGVEPGEEFMVFDIPGVGRAGICICYDLWFPEVARNLACLGAEVIICPTMTNTVDRHIELVMAQATAATNQCYLVSVNVGGEAGVGRSIFVGPQGEILYQSPGNHRDIMPLELDCGHVRRVRERGTHGLGQPLKSFRDSAIHFPAYTDEKAELPGLAGLGELALAVRKTDA